MRPGGAVIAPLISCGASGKALAERLRRWWQGFSLPPMVSIVNEGNDERIGFNSGWSEYMLINGMCYNNSKIETFFRGMRAWLAMCV